MTDTEQAVAEALAASAATEQAPADTVAANPTPASESADASATSTPSTAGESEATTPYANLADAESDVVAATEEEKKDVENQGHDLVHGALTEIEEFFARIGKDISAEVAAIKAKLL